MIYCLQPPCDVSQLRSGELIMSEIFQHSNGCGCEFASLKIGTTDDTRTVHGDNVRLVASRALQIAHRVLVRRDKCDLLLYHPRTHEVSMFIPNTDPKSASWPCWHKAIITQRSQGEITNGIMRRVLKGKYPYLLSPQARSE